MVRELSVVVAVEEVVFVLIERIFEHSGANFFGKTNDEAEVMDRSETVILALLFGVARAPHSAKTAQCPAFTTGGAVATGVEDMADVSEFAKI